MGGGGGGGGERKEKKRGGGGNVNVGALTDNSDTYVYILKQDGVCQL